MQAFHWLAFLTDYDEIEISLKSQTIFIFELLN